MKTLITGASGKLGGELVDALHGEHELVLVGRSFDKDQADKGVQYSVDLSDPTVLSEIMAQEKPEVVVHLAALLPRACQEDPELAKKVNVDATSSLASLAVQHGAAKFIFASTSAVYTQTELLPTDETSNVGPQSIYGQTKLAAEGELQRIATETDTQFTALRIFNVYGEPFTDSLVHKLTHSTEEQPVQMYERNFHRDYVHSSDVVAAIEATMDHHLPTGELTVLNIGSGVSLDNAELVAQLEANGIHPHYTAIPNDKLSVSWADISKAKELIDFQPHTTIIS